MPLMRRTRTACLGAALFALTAPALGAQGEDPLKLLDTVAGLVKSGDYARALEELAWARKSIETLHAAHIQKFLPDTLAGLAGQPPRSQGAVGLVNIAREYVKDSTRVTVSLTDSSAGGAGGGLAGLGRMAAMMGAQNTGMNSFRIQGRTATLDNRAPQRAALMVFLDSGALLKLESRGGNIEDGLLQGMAEALPLDAIDKYLAAGKTTR